jgi:hypothetical protein
MANFIRAHLQPSSRQPPHIGKARSPFADATAGLAHSAKLLIENDHHYVYVTSGALAMTQTYVPAIGEMPKAAEFRKKLAGMNEIARRPRLALGDDPDGIFSFREFYGLLAHNPVGKHFTESDQRLAMIQFCIPSKNCTKWEAQFAIEEIVSSYETAKPADKAERSLPWKKRGRAEGQE